jgi:hypothetical protein
MNIFQLQEPGMNISQMWGQGWIYSRMPRVKTFHIPTAGAREECILAVGHGWIHPSWRARDKYIQAEGPGINISKLQGPGKIYCISAVGPGMNISQLMDQGWRYPSCRARDEYILAAIH